MATKVVYKVDGNGDGQVLMVFSGGAAASQSESTFDAWVQANYPATPAHLTAEIDFNIDPATERMSLDGNSYPTGSKVAVPKDDYYVITSNGTADFDGVEAANADNVATITVTCTKKKGSDDSTDAAYAGTARVLISAGLPLDANNFNFASGVSTVVIGPVDKICDFKITAVDESANIKQDSRNLRFK
jgi:hypothetical protein